MKRICKLLIVTACVWCFVACNKTQNSEPELLWNGLYSNENQWYLDWREAETEQGFYLTVNDYADTNVTLVYFDKASRKAIPLCNQPNCDHKSIHCDASMWGYTPQVYYYEGMLYLISYDDEGTYLERMNPDGSGKQRIRTLYNEKSVYCQLIMHKDNFYYLYRNNIYALGFTEDVSQEKLLMEFPKAAGMNQLFAKGDYVYWAYAYPKDGETKASAESVAFRYHIPTGEIEELVRLPQWTYVNIAPLTDDDIYYYEVDKGLFCYHPSTGTSDVVYEEKGRVGLDVYSGGKGLYVVNWRGLKLDESVEEITVLADGKNVTNTFRSETPPGITSYLDLHFGGSDEFLFLWTNDELFYMDLTAEKLSWESTGLHK